MTQQDKDKALSTLRDFVKQSRLYFETYKPDPETKCTTFIYIELASLFSDQLTKMSDETARDYVAEKMSDIKGIVRFLLIDAYFATSKAARDPQEEEHLPMWDEYKKVADKAVRFLNVYANGREVADC